VADLVVEARRERIPGAGVVGAHSSGLP
jgi:hypothetical protein